MTRSSLSDAFYFTPDPLPREIICGFCREPIVATSSLPYFASTGMELVYRKSAGGRFVITCAEDCHPLLSLGLESGDLIELNRHRFPPLEPTCERCRTAIDRRRWRQVDRLAALASARVCGCVLGSPR